MDNKVIIDRIRTALASQLKFKLNKFDSRCIVKINQSFTRIIVLYPSNRVFIFNIDFIDITDSVIYLGLTHI